MRKIIALIITTALLVMPLWGCGSKSEDNTKIVLTSGFGKDEVFRIEDISCYLPEMMVYLTNIQDQYETVYGSEIWDTIIDGVSLEDNVKDNALSKMAQVKAINLLAKKYNIKLDDNEEWVISQATDAYMDSLSPGEINLMGINRDIILTLYREYAISEKLYDEIIRDVNPEISDDEARTITVKHILVKTYNLDEDGNRVRYTKYAKQLARNRAEEALKRAEANEDFDKLAEEYSDDNQVTYSFGKGEMDAVFENAAFNLGSDEISAIIETEYGYHIIKCVSTFNKEVTDENKIKIVEKRKNEAFSKEYDEFVTTLTKDLNTELWNQVTFINDPTVDTSNFFEIFDEYWRNR